MWVADGLEGTWSGEEQVWEQLVAGSVSSDNARHPWCGHGGWLETSSVGLSFQGFQSHAWYELGLDCSSSQFGGPEADYDDVGTSLDETNGQRGLFANFHPFS